MTAKEWQDVKVGNTISLIVWHEGQFCCIPALVVTWGPYGGDLKAINTDIIPPFSWYPIRCLRLRSVSQQLYDVVKMNDSRAI